METYNKEFQSWVLKNGIKVFSSLSEVIENPVIDLKVGMKCTFVNCYGVKFSGLTIMGFSERQNNIFTGEDTGRYVFLNYDCYWVAAKPESICLE